MSRILRLKKLEVDPCIVVDHGASLVTLMMFHGRDRVGNPSDAEMQLTPVQARELAAMLTEAADAVS